MNTQNTPKPTQVGHTPTPWEFAYGSIYKAGDGREINNENAIRIALMDRNEEATQPERLHLRRSRQKPVCRLPFSLLVKMSQLDNK